MATPTFDRFARRRLGTNWGWVLASGILFIAIGIFAAMSPFATGLAVGILLAMALISGGLIAIAAGSATIRENGGWLYVVIGALGLVLGIKTLFFPYIGAVSLVWLVGWWLLISGVMEIVSGFRTDQGRAGLIILGAVNFLLGGLLISVNPALALTYLAIAVGLSFVFRGIGSIVFAMVLRKLSRR